MSDEKETKGLDDVPPEESAKVAQNLDVRELDPNKVD
jgi:hypothetical protein